MDMKLSSEQTMLQTAARDYLTRACPPSAVRELEQSPFGYSPEIWKQMADLGWLSLPLPTEHGGMGGSHVDLALLNKELGRALCPSPFIPTAVIAATAIAEAGTEEQKRRYLPAIADGKKVVAFGFLEGSGPYDVQGIHLEAHKNSHTWHVSGKKTFVEYAQGADELLLAARLPGSRGPEGLTMFLMDMSSPGLSRQPLVTLARDAQCKVTLDGVTIPADRVLGEPGQAWPALRKALDRGILALSAQMVGAAERAHEIGMEYAKTRVQFGRPIATFQAIQHYLAQTAMEITGADTLMFYLAWSMDQGVARRDLVAKTKAFVGDSCRQAAFIACQIHGGLGAIVDVDITLYLRRAKQWQLMMGSAGEYEDLVAQELLDG